jgi:hypothetical protein
VAAAAAAARPVRLRVTREPAPPLARGEGLVFMALDVVEEAQVERYRGYDWAAPSDFP